MNTLLILSSLSQLISAQAAISYLNSKEVSNKDNLHILLINKYTSDQQKQLLEQKSKKFKIKIHDLTYLDKSDVGVISLNVLEKLKSLFLNLKSNYKYSKYLNIYIKDYINNHIGIIDKIFIRKYYSSTENICLNAINNDTIYFIEDGTADYFKKNFFSSFLNYKKDLYKLILFFYIFLFTFNYKLSFKLSNLKKYKSIQHFSILKNKQTNEISQYYLECLKKYSDFEKKIEMKALIVGTVFHSYECMNVDQEIEVYNKLISFIKNKFNLSSNNIYYKHHPRCDIEKLKKKKESLNCIVFEDDSEILVEEILLKQENIEAVFSIQSSSLLYAKNIFLVDQTYLLDIRKKRIKQFKNYLDKINYYFESKKRISQYGNYNVDILELKN